MKNLLLKMGIGFEKTDITFFALKFRYLCNELEKEFASFFSVLKNLNLTKYEQIVTLE